MFRRCMSVYNVSSVTTSSSFVPSAAGVEGGFVVEDVENENEAVVVECKAAVGKNDEDVEEVEDVPLMK